MCWCPNTPTTCPYTGRRRSTPAKGVELDRSTLADWTGRAAWWLRPLRDHLLDMLKHSGKLFADETVAPVLDPGRGRTKRGQLWAYARDDRPWGGSVLPVVAYRYAPDRKAEQPIEHLAGFRGVLQVDGYAAYRKLARIGDVQLAFCWAHVRRRFFEQAASGTLPVATDVLARIAQLYAVEADIRGQSAEARRAVRQERGRVIVDDLRRVLDMQLGQISRKGRLAEAIRYALSHWDGLCHFLADGRVELDPNTVERNSRPLTLNRKNALFAGSDDGGDNWAVIASLILWIDPQLAAQCRERSLARCIAADDVRGRGVPRQTCPIWLPSTLAKGSHHQLRINDLTNGVFDKAFAGRSGMTALGSPDMQYIPCGRAAPPPAACARRPILRLRRGGGAIARTLPHIAWLTGAGRIC